MSNNWVVDVMRNLQGSRFISKSILVSLAFFLHAVAVSAQFDGFGLPMSGANAPTLAPRPVVYDITTNAPTMEPVPATDPTILPVAGTGSSIGSQQAIPPAPVIGGIESIFGGAPAASPAPIEEDWRARQKRERAESRAAKKAAMEKRREERMREKKADDDGDDDYAGDDDNGDDESYGGNAKTIEPTLEPTVEPTMEPTEEQVNNGAGGKQKQQSWFPVFGTPSKKHTKDDDYSDNKIDDYQKDYHKEDDDGEGGRTDEKDKNRLEEAKRHKKYHKGTKLASFSDYGIDFLDSDEFMRNFGITLSVFGSLASSGGVLLQKIVKQKVEIDNSQGPEFAHFRYLAGLVCVVVGLICKAIICALLPQLTLAALSAQSFIYTLVFEHMFLDNQAELSFLSIFAAGVVFIGIILSVLASNIVDVDYSLETLHTIFLAPEALIFTGILVVIIFLPKLCLSGRSSDNNNDTTTSILDLTYRVVTAAVLAMLFGTVLKVVAEGVAYHITYGNDDVNKMKYDAVVWIILFMVLGVGKLRFISTSTQSYHPLLFLPIYQGLSAAFHTSAGVMYFHELEVNEARGAVNVNIYTVGMSCVVLGLVLFAMNYDPNVHSIPNKEEYSEDKESLLNANLDYIYGPPGGKRQHYPNQGHSGEPRRGEMKNPRQMMYDEYDHEYTNPMMDRRSQENMMRDNARNPRYDTGRGRLQRGRHGEEEMQYERERREQSRRMPPPQIPRRAEPPMMYDNYDDDDLEYGRPPIQRQLPQYNRNPIDDGRQRRPGYRGPTHDMNRGMPSKDRRPPPNTNSSALYTGGLQY